MRFIVCNTTDGIVFEVKCYKYCKLNIITIIEIIYFYYLPTNNNIMEDWKESFLSSGELYVKTLIFSVMYLLFIFLNPSIIFVFVLIFIEFH